MTGARRMPIEEMAKERDKQRKDAKRKGAVECACCSDIINDVECVQAPTGSFFHVGCAPDYLPRVIVGGRLLCMRRVGTPGKQKKRDNRFWMSERFRFHWFEEE